MWIRGTWPRFRIDQMLGFAWKVLVPASLANLLWVAVVLKLPVPAARAVGPDAGRQPGDHLVVAATMLGRAAKRYAGCSATLLALDWRSACAAVSIRRQSVR